MKKNVFLFLVALGFVFHANASTPYGGHITYKHLVDYSYEITVTIYTDAASLYQDPLIDMNWGDGSTIDLIERTSFDIIEGNLQKNLFITTHDFMAPGNYVISLTENNRPTGIMNLNQGNSVEITFYVESELIISSEGFDNNSVDYLAPIVFNVVASQPLQTNFASLDLDGDILSYALVAPKENGIGMDDIYFFPDGLSINSNSGELTWNTPLLGDFVIAVKITECRDGMKVGSVVVDVRLSVSANETTDANFIDMENWPVDSDNNYVLTVVPNQMVNLGMAFSNTGNSDPVVLVGFGEPFLNGNGATYVPGTMTVTYINRLFNWTPTYENVRCAPYLVTFRGYLFSDNATEVQDVSLLIYVHDETMDNCAAACSQLVSSVYDNEFSNIEMTIYPNPFTAQTTISILNPAFADYDQLHLYDLSGRLVKTIAVMNQKEITFQRDGLNAGIYVYNLVNGSRVVGVGKMVVVD